MSRKVRRLARFILYLFAGSFVQVSPPVDAQGALPSTPAPILSAPSLLVGNLRIVTDLFLGKNLVGPYLLSWKGIEPNGETVVRDGQRLTRDVDYRLDAATGTLVFTEPLPIGQTARIDYTCSTDKASQNNPQSLLPTQVSLLQSAGNAFALNALFRPDLGASSAGSKNASPAAMMLLGLNGNARLAPQSSLTAKLFVDAQGGNLMNRSALQLNENSQTRYGKFNVGFTRGGSDFQESDVAGITAGKQVIQTSGSLNPLFGIQASASFQQTRDLPIKGQGEVDNIFGQRLVGNLGSSTRLQAIRTETLSQAANGTNSTRLADHLQIDQKLGFGTQATALFDQTTTSDKDSRQVAQTSGLSVHSQPDSHVSVDGSYKNQLLPSGNTDTTHVSVQATATKQIKVTALADDRFDPKSALHDRQASVEYAPLTGLSLSSSVQVRTQGGNEEIAQGFNATAQPNKFLQVSGGVKLRNATNMGAPDPTVPDTVSMKMSLGLLRGAIRLTGDYADNPEDDKGVVSRLHSQSVGIQSTWGHLNFTGGYALQNDYVSSHISTQLNLNLGWRFAPTTQLVTGYKQSETLSSDLLDDTTYSLSINHSIGSLLNLAISGNMTTHLKDGLLLPNTEYLGEVKLGVRF